MKHLVLALVMTSLVASTAALAADKAKPAPEKSKPTAKVGTKVAISTSMGDIEVELDADKAPKSVANFLEYVKAGHYEGTIFHRVINNFMIQGGGFDASLKQKETRPSIPIEADNGLKNERGTLAMARTMDPNSASSQFFINVQDNAFLNHTAKTTEGWGYTVFGKVTKGMDVVDKIKAVKTGSCGQFREDCPLDKVVIKKASVVK